jgi:hypothetical protein
MRRHSAKRLSRSSDGPRPIKLAAVAGTAYGHKVGMGVDFSRMADRILPAGRARLATRQSLTGSLETKKAMDIVVPANAEGIPSAKHSVQAPPDNWPAFR